MRNINPKQIPTQKTIHPQFPNKLISRDRAMVVAVAVAVARAVIVAMATARIGVGVAVGVGVGAGAATGAWARGSKCFWSS